MKTLNYMGEKYALLTPGDEKTIKLGNRQKAILFEAGRRLAEFHEGEDPLKAWSGLGMPSEYQTVVKADLMRPISREYPRCAQWYVLTKKGLEQVKRLGYLAKNAKASPEIIKHVMTLS